jgi:RsiW-degrading membrane proteinase PrsW (M82 family)
MADRWFYAVGEERRGPVEKDEILRMIADGRLRRTTLVWTKTLTDWTPAGELAELKNADWPSPARAEDTQPTVATRKKDAAPAPSAGQILRGIGRKISDFAELSTISRMPVRRIVAGGLSRAAKPEQMEETFAVGTPSTTPPLSEVEDGWPTPRVFWRVLLGAIGADLLLRIGAPEFPGFLRGIGIIGSFVVPLALVILFFELNTPKNVSVYQVGKLLLLGGALSLLLTSMLVKALPGSGSRNLLPAMLGSILEETAKALALLVVVRNARYRWQLNGLLFGAAVGAGFAGFASSGWVDEPFRLGLLAGLLSPAAHVIWTAIVGSAIWKARGDKKFQPGMLLEPVVIRRWAIAVVLHGLWLTAIGPPWVRWIVLSVAGWYIVLGIVTQALDEVGAAKKKAAA